MPSLVVGGHFLLFLRHGECLALSTHHDLVPCILELAHGNLALVATGREQRRLVDEVSEIRARKAGRAARDVLRVDVLAHGLAAHVDAEDFLASVDVGQGHFDLTVEATGTQQSFIEHIRAVGGRDDDDALIAFEAIHFDQKLVEGLLALLVAAGGANAAVAAHRIDLVDEDDAGRVFARFGEHVAHTAGAYAHEHLHKVRAGDREEGHARFTRDRARQQRLTRPRRTDQQRARRDARTKTRELAGVLEILDNLLEVLLGRLHTCHILEGAALRVLGQQFRARFAEAHRAAAALALHGSQDVDADTHEQEKRKYAEQAADPRALLLHFGVLNLDARRGKGRTDVAVDARRVGHISVTVGFLARDEPTRLLDGGGLDRAGFRRRQQFTVGVVLGLGCTAQAVLRHGDH